MQGFSPASIGDCCNLERCIFQRALKIYFMHGVCIFFWVKQFKKKNILCCCLCKYIKLVNIKDYFLLQASNINFYGILCVFPYLLMFEKKEIDLLFWEKMVHKKNVNRIKKNEAPNIIRHHLPLSLELRNSCKIRWCHG